jgi:hypothetical protein
MKLVATEENSQIIEALVDALKALNIGDVLTNERIDNLVRDKRHLLYKARSIVEREHGYAFGTMIRVGIKRIAGTEVHLIGQTQRKRAVKGLRRAKGRIIGVLKSETTPLSREDKLKCNSELSKIGIAAEFLVD